MSGLLLTSRIDRQPRRFSIAPDAVPVVAQIAASADDAYEMLNTDAVTLDGEILFLSYDGAIGLANGKTIVGLRWSGLSIAQGDPVPFAQVRFASSNGNSTPVVLRIWCEDADDAAAFTTTAENLSARTKTTAYVDWDVPPWSVDQDDANTRTPDLSGPVQEVVNRAGFNGTIVVLIELSPANTDTAAPRRRAVSFDLDAARAPRLYLNTTDDPGGGGGVTPTGDFADGYESGDTFGLVGNEAFNPASPTLKDGTAITGDLLTYWTAAAYGHLNSTATSGNWRLVNPVWALGQSSSYTSSREAQTCLASMLFLFRLTGDLRLLDRVVDAWDAAKGPERVSWDGHDCSAIEAAYSWMACPPASGDAWSPYSKWVDYSTGWFRGTDLQYQNTNKHAALMVEACWAFYVNRTLDSPAHGAGAYQTAFDYWKVRVEGFVKTWSEPHEAGTWTGNYEGDQYLKSRRRAPVGTYPLVYRNGTHVGMQAAPFHHYLGLLGKHAGLDVTNPDDALAWVSTLLTEAKSKLAECTSPFGGDTLVLLDDFVNPTDMEPHGGSYIRYTAAMWIQLWLTGRYRGIFDHATMEKIGLSYSDAHNADGTTKPDLLGGVSKCGLTSVRTSSSTRTQNAESGYASMLVFEDQAVTTRQFDVAESIQAAEAGGWTTPDSGMLATALFVREALDAVGDLD